MPAWSTEVANEFISLAAAENKTFNQLQLQALVYIAHGWCLAMSGEPLTGDRPEAWRFGPVYRRLADALAPLGNEPAKQIDRCVIYPDLSVRDTRSIARTDLNSFELEVIADVYRDYGAFEFWQLSAITRKGETTPWHKVYAGGAGEFCDISHNLIREQFLGLMKRANAQEE